MLAIEETLRFKLQSLKEKIGWRAFNSLKAGNYLYCWEGSAPYNWFIRGMSVEFLWHSNEETRETLKEYLDLFDQDGNSALGSKQFLLKKEYRKLKKEFLK